MRWLAADLEGRYNNRGGLTASSEDARCEGAWEFRLVLNDTQLFRSAPFFMADRAVCADGAEARRYDAFCDLHRAALPVSTIGRVRQVASLRCSAPSLTSEFEVRAGAVPLLSDRLPRGLPLPGLSGGVNRRVCRWGAPHAATLRDVPFKKSSGRCCSGAASGPRTRLSPHSDRPAGADSDPRATGPVPPRAL